MKRVKKKATRKLPALIDATAPPWIVHQMNAMGGKPMVINIPKPFGSETEPIEIPWHIFNLNAAEVLRQKTNMAVLLTSWN